MTEELLIVPKRIYVASRTVVKESRDRYKIYLPTSMNRLWKALEGKKVDIYIVVLEDDKQ